MHNDSNWWVDVDGESVSLLTITTSKLYANTSNTSKPYANASNTLITYSNTLNTLILYSNTINTLTQYINTINTLISLQNNDNNSLIQTTMECAGMLLELENVPMVTLAETDLDRTPTMGQTQSNLNDFITKTFAFQVH